MDETTDKEKASNQPACLDLYSLSFQLTNYVTKTLSNLTVCFERKTGIEIHNKSSQFSTFLPLNILSS
ncbi:hypothetical protein QS594_12660, partial [Escherichia coli]|nr:hypothetical protein [Escherichia coli]